MKYPKEIRPHIKKYGGQKIKAKRRGVDWQLTFQEWYDWWQATGHYEERGRGREQYCMCRYGDTGPYSLSNIFCQTSAQNVSDAKAGKSSWNKGISPTEETRQKLSLKIKGKPNLKNRKQA